MNIMTHTYKNRSPAESLLMYDFAIEIDEELGYKAMADKFRIERYQDIIHLQDDVKLIE